MSNTAFIEKARQHWTEARTAKVTGGKRFLLLPSETAPLLRVMGLLNADASMPADAVRKYSQVNHLLSLLTPALKDLAERHREVRIVDAGCGKSYLLLSLAWCGKRSLNLTGKFVGIDGQEKLIAKSRAQAAELDLATVCDFVVGRIGEVDFSSVFGPPEAEGKVVRPHAVFALHACDTATDEALAGAVKAKADFIAVAPCCQAELAAKWKERGTSAVTHPLTPVFRAPEPRRAIAADMTDMLRILVLRANGYEVTATEFVGSEHTPKNRLILATRRGNYLESARQECAELVAHLGGDTIRLLELLSVT